MIGIALSRVQVTSRYSAFRQKCEIKYFRIAQHCQVWGESNTVKTALLPKMLFIVEFQKDLSRKIRFSTNRNFTILGAKGFVGYVTERQKSIFATGVAKATLGVRGRSPTTNHTHFGVIRSFSFKKRENGARAKIARQAAGECTPVLPWCSPWNFCALSWKSSVVRPIESSH